MDKNSFAYKVFSIFVGLSGIQAYTIIFIVLLACGLGVPIPEDITLLAAGYLAGKGQIELWGAIVVGFVGVMAGDSFLFMVGRRYGRRVFTWPVARRLFTPERVAIAEKRIQKNARIICFMARFAPGLRSVIFLTSGVMKVPFRTFFIQDGGAALLSVPFWVILAWHFHDDIDRAFGVIADSHIYIGIAFALVIIFFVAKYYINKRALNRPK